MIGLMLQFLGSGFKGRFIGSVMPRYPVLRSGRELLFTVFGLGIVLNLKEGIRLYIAKERKHDATH